MLYGLHLAVRTGVVLAIALAGTSAPARADVRLPAIFGDHMVLQEGRPLPFWGKADPGEAVTVSAAGQTARTTAGKDGRWRVTLPAPAADAARAPFTVTIAGRNQITLTDVVLGEVWLASGQSNMEWPLVAAAGGEADVQAANLPELRLFHVAKPAPDSLVADPAEPVSVRGQWARSTPESAALFSAVGYFFGRTLAARRGRPVGIIHSSYGGSRAETWVRRARLRAHPALKALVTSTPAPPSAEATASYRQALARWNAARPAPPAPGKAQIAAYALPTGAAGGWRTAEVPAAFAAGPAVAAAPGASPGPVWWRRQVELPSAFVGQPLTLRLGGVDSCDASYVDGVKVGATCREQPQHQHWPRVYAIPASLTRRRMLTIAVRVSEGRGPIGLRGPRAAMKLALGPGADAPAVPLGGPGWWTATETAATAVATADAAASEPPPPRPTPPPGTRTYQMPGVLWDHMIADLAPIALAGVIWYQGESNVRRAEQYRTLLPALITDWRQAFGHPKLPFLIVQLASYHPRWPGPGQKSEEEWPELRDAQAAVAAGDRASGLVVTLDVGERDDIHPLDKNTVGWRLALTALDRVYGQTAEHAGPTLAGFTREPDGRVRVRFHHAAGLTLGGRFIDRLVGFELAGRDRHYVAADARIEGDTVVLSAPTVTSPVAVRYGWGDDPLCNLVNRAGLPAAPFRTDRWPRLTAGRRLP